MEMRFFWIGDKVSQKNVRYILASRPREPGRLPKLGDHAMLMCNPGIYTWHMENSPRFLPRAMKPSTLKGCVGTLQYGYIHKVPLPRESP